MTTTTEPSLLRHLRTMDNYAFEMLVADVWEEFGYETTVSQESNEKGLDVMALHRETGKRVAIQAKCYAGSNRIGRPAVQQYSSLYQQENADRSPCATLVFHILPMLHKAYLTNRPEKKFAEATRQEMMPAT